MGTINFTKMNGAGNDFILIDENKNKNVVLNKTLIQTMCDRRKGIGADGVVLIKQNKIQDFELVYYNSNGLIGSLCGNGSRCAIKYVKENRTIKSESTTFVCNNEVYKGKILLDGKIQFFLKEPKSIRLNMTFNLNDTSISGSFINTGSPHFVINWDEIKHKFEGDFDNFEINNLGKKIRSAEQFAPEGTNVNFVMRESKNNSIRTYERGVEEETLACGTGTVAAAIIFSLQNQINTPVTFKTRSGENLEVNFVKNNGKFSKITLTGPAKINYIGTFNY